MAKHVQQREKLTNRVAERLAEGLRWDAEIPGFGLRVLPSGRKVWVLKYLTRTGRQGWLTLGTFPAQSADDARSLARDARKAVEQGRDPSAERRAARAAAREASGNVAGRLLAPYAVAIRSRPALRGRGFVSERHAENELSNLRHALAEIGAEALPVASIGTEHVAALLRHHAARPATARARFGALSRFLDWCREERVIAANPAEAITARQRPKPPKPRSRVVPLSDLAALWHAAAALSPTYADFVRILIALPVRRGEAARMDWRDLDLGKGEWCLPGAITKNGDPHRLALPPLALRLLRDRHKAAGHPAEGLVFPPARGLALGAWSAVQRRLRDLSGIAAFSFHDFRRSFASIMAERGVPEPVADAVLNHRQSATRGGVLGVYQHAQRWPEQRAAMLAWGRALEQAIRHAATARELVSQ
jgi:integrase